MDLLDRLFRFGTDAYGERILLGANWQVFWWFVVAGFVVIGLHAISVPLIERRRAKLQRGQSRR